MVGRNKGVKKPSVPKVGAKALSISKEDLELPQAPFNPLIYLDQA